MGGTPENTAADKLWGALIRSSRFPLPPSKVAPSPARSFLVPSPFVLSTTLIISIYSLVAAAGLAPAARARRPPRASQSSPAPLAGPRLVRTAALVRAALHVAHRLPLVPLRRGPVLLLSQRHRIRVGVVVHPQPIVVPPIRRRVAPGHRRARVVGRVGGQPRTPPVDAATEHAAGDALRRVPCTAAGIPRLDYGRIGRCVWLPRRQSPARAGVVQVLSRSLVRPPPADPPPNKMGCDPAVRVNFLHLLEPPLTLLRVGEMDALFGAAARSPRRRPLLPRRAAMSS